MAGSAFEKEWRTHKDPTGATKKEARYWFGRGMIALQKTQDENKNKHPGITEVVQFEADSRRLFAEST